MAPQNKKRNASFQFGKRESLAQAKRHESGIQGAGPIPRSVTRDSAKLAVTAAVLLRLMAELLAPSGTSSKMNPEAETFEGEACELICSYPGNSISGDLFQRPECF